MNLIHYGSHRHSECGLNDTDGTLKDSDTLTLVAGAVTCATCRGWLPLVAPERQRYQPVPVPQGDGRHDIGDDVRAAIFHRLHDDFTLAAPWANAEQRRQLAMLAAASVRALLHELGTLRDMEKSEGNSAKSEGNSRPTQP